MDAGRNQRISFRYTQTNVAAPARVFPLLCPVREAEWLPGWRYRMVHSDSGVAELGCVFATPDEDGSETIWVVTEYDPQTLRIAFVWVRPGLVATRLTIALRAAGVERTYADIAYTYTGLSQEGNELVASYTEAWFAEKMRGWESAINLYLRK